MGGMLSTASGVALGADAAPAARNYARGARVPDGIGGRIRAQNAAAQTIALSVTAQPDLARAISVARTATPPAPRTRFDWRYTHKVTPVRNQGSCGSCWIFAALGAFESAYLIANKDADVASLHVSEQQLLDCTFSETNCVVGGWHEVVMTYLMTLGGVEATRYSYNSQNPQRESYCNANFGTRPFLAHNSAYVSGSLYIPPVADLKQAILSHGPCVSGVTADESWNSYAGGVLNGKPSTRTPNDINHEVLIVGWDDTVKTASGSGVWIVKNSWDTDWGGDNQGYALLPYGVSNIGFAASWVDVLPNAVGAQEGLSEAVDEISAKTKLLTLSNNVGLKSVREFGKMFNDIVK